MNCTSFMEVGATSLHAGTEQDFTARVCMLSFPFGATLLSEDGVTTPPFLQYFIRVYQDSISRSYLLPRESTAL